MNATFVAMTLLDALLLWAVVRTRGWWVPKAIAIVVVLAFNFVLISAAGNGTGWPASAGIPDGSRLIACDVVEPNAIYFWVVPETPPGRFGYRWIAGEPKAYRLPYSREMHSQCQSAQKALMHGGDVHVRRTTGRAHAPRGHSVGRYHLYLVPQSLPPKRRDSQ